MGEIIHTEPTAIGSVLTELADTARDLAREAMAPNTRRAYAASWGVFSGWCADAGLSALPATAGNVALYVAHLVEIGRKPATISGALAAIAAAHRVAGHASPTEDESVRLVVRGARRALGTRQEGKRAIGVGLLKQIVATCQDSPIGRRDRALLLLGFAGAMRRSELVGLDVADVASVRDGVVVTIRKSKTDQTGQGHDVAIPYGSDPSTCPVRALADWIASAEIASGPIFRSVNRHGRIGADRLSDRAVAIVVKRACSAAGISPDAYAGHSLRSGLVTSSAEAGKPLDVIMRQTRHRSHAVALSYVRRADAFKSNAASGIGL